MKYIIISPTSDFNLMEGITKIKVLSKTPTLTWVCPTDLALKPQWLIFKTRRSAEKMIQALKNNVLFADMFMVTYGIAN